jgi:cytoplasmic iron level regulating protein YaaA (DUF328/UPF0246 family)
MLILVPSSEGKRAPTSGAPLDLQSLSFPELTDLRAAVLGALIKTSGEPDRLDRIAVGASLIGELERNRSLSTQPTGPVLEIYDGVLHRALDAGSLSARAKRRAAHSLLLASSLFGLLRPSDHIPPYRLPVDADLLGLPSLAKFWRSQLSATLATASADTGVILDLRAASHRSLAPSDPGRTLTIRLAPGVAGGNTTLKRTRGLTARRLLERADLPTTPAALAGSLDDSWSVDLTAPGGPAQGWVLVIDPMSRT